MTTDVVAMWFIMQYYSSIKAKFNMGDIINIVISQLSFNWVLTMNLHHYDQHSVEKWC